MHFLGNLIVPFQLVFSLILSLSSQAFTSTRLADTDRLRGGIVFVEKLAKDHTGRLIVNLDKFDKDAEEIDEVFIREQPKITVR